MGSCLEALLIEDNCSDAQLVETIIGLSDQVQPLTIHHVDRFSKAINVLQTTEFDVALLDLHLPDGEGTALIGQLKKIAPQMPVVVITGMSDLNAEAVAFSEGADDYLIKPSAFSPQRIAELGYINVGNLLVQRLYDAVKQARFLAALEADETQVDLPLQERLHSLYSLDVENLSTKHAFPEETAFSKETVLADTADSALPSPGATASLSDIGRADTYDPLEHFVQTTFYSMGVTLMSTLGLLYMEEDCYAKAEPLLEGALEIRKRLLGSTHPDAIVSLHNLATLYDNQGRYLEAEELFYDALKLCEEVFGVESSLTRKFRTQALVIARLNQGMDRSDLDAK